MEPTVSNSPVSVGSVKISHHCGTLTSLRLKWSDPSTKFVARFTPAGTEGVEDIDLFNRKRLEVVFWGAFPNQLNPNL